MRNRWIIAAVLVAIGLIWIGQGSGVIRGSGFMTDDVRWAIVGAIVAVVGFFIGWTAFRARLRP